MIIHQVENLRKGTTFLAYRIINSALFKKKNIFGYFSLSL